MGNGLVMGMHRVPIIREVQYKASIGNIEVARLQQKQQDNRRGSVITTEVARLQQRHQGSHRGSK